MFDIIKTFILGILVDRRYRFIFIFIAISLIYRFFLWSVVAVRYELSPVYFVGVNKNRISLGRLKTALFCCVLTVGTLDGLKSDFTPTKHSLYSE